jgi:hypothetical protein
MHVVSATKTRAWSRVLLLSREKEVRELQLALWTDQGVHAATGERLQREVLPGVGSTSAAFQGEGKAVLRAHWVGGEKKGALEGAPPDSPSTSLS